jgi:hypothetical protein
VKNDRRSILGAAQQTVTNYAHFGSAAGYIGAAGIVRLMLKCEGNVG